MTYAPSAGINRLAELIAGLEAQETAARRRARALEEQLADLRLRAASAAALLELRERHLEERAETEASIRAELRSARTELKIAHLRLSGLEPRLVTLDADRVRREQRLEELEHERERLLIRSERLDSVTDARAYRFVQWTWRARAALRHPFRSRRPRESDG